MKKSSFVRRLSAWLMAAVMLLSTVPAMAAFNDTVGHWAEKTLNEWQDKGLIAGRGNGGFEPDGTMTRAEFAKLVNRTMGFTAESAISFSDVTERDWFYAEVARAVAAGYAQGSGGAFRPNQPVTRAEAATMLARALDLAANEERANVFTDAASIPVWAKGSVGAVAEAGCMNGYPDGAFGVGSSITRAEAVVTLDRVRKSAKETVIENAGTTLENKAVNGDLIIAASVGEGNVTLKNVTVRGNLIVKGGGANSVYLDGTKVNGDVQMQKENVHLHLMGDTALGRMELGMPCRITQNSSFKGALGTIVIDLEKASGKKIQIEVPAKLVELLSRANVVLNADMETLQIDKDAEGAQLEIKRGTTVGGLTADAKVELTGSGTVASLVVSVNGVTVSGSLNVKKTDAEDGAKAPAVSGGSSGSSGSSGGSSMPVKIVTGAAAISDVTVPYSTSAADAMRLFPGSVTLNVTEDGKANTVSAAVSWALDKAYNEDPRVDTVYTATGTVTIPDGYTYDGTLTVTAKLTVEADPEKVVVRISEVAGLELPYGTQQSAAQLPTLVTVEIKNGDTERADVTWTLDGEWVSPGVNTFTGRVYMPAFCYYNGEMNADIKTTATVLESGATPKIKAVVDHVPLALTSIGYASTEELVLAAARQKGLPTDITLECKDGSYIPAVVGPDDWKFTQTPYTPTPSENQTVSFTENVALPAGYAYDGGTSPVRCYVEVKALNTAALDGALAAAQSLQKNLTTDEMEAATDPTNKVLITSETNAAIITKGVRFTTSDAQTALTNAVTAATTAQTKGFASQQECTDQTTALTAAVKAFKDTIKTGENATTNAYILNAVKKWLNDNREQANNYAYDSTNQPLRQGKAYELPASADLENNLSVKFEWSKNDDTYLEMTQNNSGGNYSLTVKTVPTKPTQVTFAAKITRNDTNAVVGTINYTATVGAPIQVNTAASVTAPKMTSAKANNISVHVPLTGANYITGIDTSKITVEENTSTSVSITAAPITEDGSCTANSDGLFVPVTASCGAMEMRLAQTNSGLGYGIGKIKITIPSGALTVDESSGWYAPAGALTYDAEVWGCNPAVTVMTQSASSGRKVTVQIEYAYRKFSGAVVYTPIDYRTNSERSTPGATAAEGEAYVPFGADDWQDGLEKDCITCTKNVSLDLNRTYYVWCNFSGDSYGALNTPGNWINTGMMIQ